MTENGNFPLDSDPLCINPGVQKVEGTGWNKRQM